MGDENNFFKSYPTDKEEGHWKGKGSGQASHDFKPKNEKTWGAEKPKEGEEAKPAFKKSVGIGPIYENKDAGAHLTTKKSAEDKSYASLGHYEGSIEALGASYDIDEKKAELKVVEAKGKFSVVHAEVDFVDAVKKLFGAKKTPPPAQPSAPGGGGGPMAARVTDLTGHGTPLVPGIGSPNVFIGGLPAWRALADFHVCPIVKGVVPDVGGMVLKGSPTVLINFMMACRVGDMVVEIPGGPNPIAMGCPTVMIGEAGSGAGEGGGGDGGEKKEPAPNVKGELTAKGDLGTVEGNVALGAQIDLKSKEASAKAEIGGLAALAKGEISGALKFRIPFTEHYVGIGSTLEGSAGSIGAKAGGEAYFNKVDPATGKRVLFKGSAGAKGALGLGGGLKFSLTIE